ncbi:MAG: hypothetical protein FJ280_21780 [Planctomycetes bacterium]|nr:hypothetical protein [Planctomycetota bacterium]
MVLLVRHRQDLRKAFGLAAATHPDCYPGLNQAHFVLCWSNWETGTVCFLESYESLSQGSQNVLWKLGGVPQFWSATRRTFPPPFTRKACRAPEKNSHTPSFCQNRSCQVVSPGREI